MNNSTIDLINIQSEQYSEITGATLDARIVAWMAAAGYPLTATDRLQILEKLPASVASTLAGVIKQVMEGDEVRSALIAKKRQEEAIEVEYVFEVVP